MLRGDARSDSDTSGDESIIDIQLDQLITITPDQLDTQIDSVAFSFPRAYEVKFAWQYMFGLLTVLAFLSVWIVMYHQWFGIRGMLGFLVYSIVVMALTVKEIPTRLIIDRDALVVDFLRSM